MVIISKNILKHVLRKHRDIAKLIDVKGVEELRRIIADVVENPDEAYMDALDVKYFLKKIDELYINIVVLNDTVKTAYLISPKTYYRLRRKKWVQRLY
ncbi:MAG: hypothetical protein H3Z53_01670 [archaeon]|nr:hypothetical protein [archaeon]